MSILVVHASHKGLILAADRNITESRIEHDGSEIVVGQTQRGKVFRSADGKIILGYAGSAVIAGRESDLGASFFLVDLAA